MLRYLFLIEEEENHDYNNNMSSEWHPTAATRYTNLSSTGVDDKLPHNYSLQTSAAPVVRYNNIKYFFLFY